MSSENLKVADSLQQGVAWVAKHWPRVRLGHEGLMLDKIARQSRIVETLARNTMTGNFQDVSGWPGHEGEDDMGVSIGDQIHHHYHESPQPVQPPSQPEPQPASQASSLSGIAAKALPWVAATGIGLGGYWLGNQTTINEAPSDTVIRETNSYSVSLQKYTLDKE